MNSKKKRLCIVTPAHWEAFMGGSQYQVKCLLDELIPTRRYEVSYLANIVAPGPQPEDYRIVPIGRRHPRFGYLMHTMPLYRALLEARPDVIYQRVACGYTGIAAHYARRHGARLIWHVAHDSDVSPDSSIHGRNPIRRFLEKRSVSYGIQHVDNIVTQTHDQAALLLQNFGREADAVIPNFHPTPIEKIDKSGPPTVIWVANLKPFKKPEAFVRLAESLSDLKDVRFKMVGAVMVAPREQNWAESLMKRINATPNLDYLGKKSQEEVNQLLAQAHLFVNTSLHEGFANTFIQAWMREVPVVSLHVNPDRIFDKQRIGVHAGSEDELQKCVRNLITHENLRREHGNCARNYARSHHSTDNARYIAELIDKGRITESRANATGLTQRIL